VSLFERKLPKKREIEDLSLKVDLAVRKTKKRRRNDDDDWIVIVCSLYIHQSNTSPP
jgi:hypothetical protein